MAKDLSFIDVGKARLSSKVLTLHMNLKAIHEKINFSQKLEFTASPFSVV